MANLVQFGTGTTTADITITWPPGATDGAIGAKLIVIDAIIITAGTTAGITAGTIELRSAGGSVGQLASGLASGANSTLHLEYEFPGGLAFPGPTFQTKVLGVSITGAAQSRSTIIYHYE